MVSKNNVRTLISIPKEVKKQLEKLAEADDRSFNNYVAKVLKTHIDKSNHPE